MLDLPTKQHTDNVCSQPTCGRKIRGKLNAKHVYTQIHLPTLTHTHTTHIQEIIFKNYFYLQALHRTEEHLMLVTQERSLYRNEVERSREAVHVHFGQEGVFVPPTPNRVIAPATNPINVHYSFDFAQQVYYPSNPLQPGPIYFLTPRKAAIFDICCEAIPRQVNFIIDEDCDTGKGANTVVSLLDYFFEHYGLGETTVSLHADNCVASQARLFALCAKHSLVTLVNFP